jgi:hypothetical protein
MNYRNWITKVAAIAFLSFAVVQVHAFVYMPSTEAVSEDSSELMDRIEAIGTGVEDETLSSDKALAEINEVIDEIDGLLDSEPANEGELLDLRDALVDMRLELSTEQVEEVQTVGLAAPAVGGGIVSGGGGCNVCSTGGGGGFSFGGGGGGIALGGGGGGGLIGFATSPLGIAAIAGTIVAVTAGGDDDDDVASM